MIKVILLHVSQEHARIILFTAQRPFPIWERAFVLFCVVRLGAFFTYELRFYIGEGRWLFTS